MYIYVYVNVLGCLIVDRYEERESVCARERERESERVKNLCKVNQILSYSEIEEEGM
jgi:hypothetical protein